MGTIHHSSLWDGSILLLNLSFDGIFANSEEILLPWSTPINSHDGGNISCLLLASYNFLLSPWPFDGHSLWPVMESEIAPDWLLSWAYIWPRRNTYSCPTASGYEACPQCRLIHLPPATTKIWSVSLTSPYALQTQRGTFKALQVVSLTYLSHLV